MPQQFKQSHKSLVLIRRVKPQVWPLTDGQNRAWNLATTCGSVDLAFVRLFSGNSFVPSAVHCAARSALRLRADYFKTAQVDAPDLCRNIATHAQNYEGEFWTPDKYPEHFACRSGQF